MERFVLSVNGGSIFPPAFRNNLRCRRHQQGALMRAALVGATLLGAAGLPMLVQGLAYADVRIVVLGSGMVA